MRWQIGKKLWVLAMQRLEWLAVPSAILGIWFGLPVLFFLWVKLMHWLWVAWGIGELLGPKPW